MRSSTPSNTIPAISSESTRQLRKSAQWGRLGPQEIRFIEDRQLQNLRECVNRRQCLADQLEWHLPAEAHGDIQQRRLTDGRRTLAVDGVFLANSIALATITRTDRFDCGFASATTLSIGADSCAFASSASARSMRAGSVQSAMPRSSSWIRTALARAPERWCARPRRRRSPA
jgi:hypothetical protein